MLLLCCYFFQLAQCLLCPIGCYERACCIRLAFGPGYTRPRMIYASLRPRYRLQQCRTVQVTLSSCPSHRMHIRKILMLGDAVQLLCKHEDLVTRHIVTPRSYHTRVWSVNARQQYGLYTQGCYYMSTTCMCGGHNGERQHKLSCAILRRKNAGGYGCIKPVSKPPSHGFEHPVSRVGGWGSAYKFAAGRLQIRTTARTSNRWNPCVSCTRYQGTYYGL